MENEKAAFVQPALLCQDKCLTELPYATEVK